MTEEVQALAESAPAPEQVATAVPESEVKAPEVVENQTETTEEKKYSQAEIDAMIGKRLAREQRKWEREQSVKQAETLTRQQVSRELPPADQFESPEVYAEVLAHRRAEELIAQREHQRTVIQTEDAYAEREEAAMDRYDDFDQVVKNPNLPITDYMAQAIKSSDVGPDVAYWLGTNPKEASRISRLSPLLQAKEIGRIEAKIATEPPVRKTTSAPAPISPVTARASGNPSYDTTDPRSTKTMSDSEWIEADRRRQMKKWEAQRTR
jgi:hypothetical protein